MVNQFMGKKESMLNNKTVVAALLGIVSFIAIDGGTAEAKHGRCHGGRAWRHSNYAYSSTGYTNQVCANNATAATPGMIDATAPSNPGPAYAPAPPANAPAAASSAPLPASAPAPAPIPVGNAANLDGENPQAVKPDRAP